MCHNTALRLVWLTSSQSSKVSRSAAVQSAKAKCSSHCGLRLAFTTLVRASSAWFRFSTTNGSDFLCNHTERSGTKCKMRCSECNETRAGTRARGKHIPV